MQEKRRRPKRLPAEVQAMVDGGLELVRVMIALFAAIVKKGGTAAQIHALAQPGGEATIDRMADVFFGPVAVAARFTTWKTVTLGTKTIGALREALKVAGCRISDWAAQILAKIALASQKTTVELVRVTGAQLGQTENENLDQICERAEAYELARCPAEVGPQLRLQYTDQPMGEVVYVAMDPVTGAGGDPSVFSVEHDWDGRWLYARYANPCRVWSPGLVWVFVRSKQ